MTEQNYRNHRRLVPIWHYLGAPLLLGLFICSVVYFFSKNPDALLLKTMVLIASIMLIMIYLYCRSFALKAQDRAIRAEENFRHFMLTGKPLDPRLRPGQIIALRFAGDEEFPSLAQKAISENLSNKQIKQLVRNWRGDHYRV